MVRRQAGPVPAIAGVFFLLTGCCVPYYYAPKSTAELADALSRRYADRPADQFFTEFGLPSGEFEQSDGRARIYRWDSSRLYLMPAQARVMSCMSPEGRYQTVDAYRGTTQTHYCELRIYTDDRDDIRSFAVAVDSTGKWSASRCSELFSNP